MLARASAGQAVWSTAPVNATWADAAKSTREHSPGRGVPIYSHLDVTRRLAATVTLEVGMLSTMQDGQLSLANLLRHGTTVHGAGEAITWTGSDARRESYAELGRNAARLANALRGLGINGDQRVGTFMWNNAEHFAAYFAVPAMGAVLHTLNIRLFPEQLSFVVNHAEDQVVLVDGTLVPLLAKQLPSMKTVRHVLVAGGDPASLDAPSGVEVHSYEELLAAQPDTFAWPEVDERS